MAAPGMVAIAGGKSTTYRVMGKNAVDLAADDYLRAALVGAVLGWSAEDTASSSRYAHRHAQSV